MTDAQDPPTARYRKRPVVIDAYQTTEPLDIETLEGTMHANPGDWIITGLRGEKYPCKPDIFAASYEPEAAAEAGSEAWNLLVEAAARDEQLTQARTQVAAYQRHCHALGQYLLDAHKPGEVDHEAVAILDGYHIGAREVAGGGHGEPGETTLEAALRLLKLAHARGAFAAAEHVVTPATAPTGPTFRVALIDSVEAIPDWVDPEEFKDAGFEDGYSACIAIFNAGKISYRWDGGEPEDNLYLRDWAWVAPALANAYEAGFDDARSGAVPTTWAEICDKIKALGLRCYIRGGEGVETALMIDGPAVYYAPEGIHKAPQGPRIADVYDHAAGTFLPRVVDKNVVPFERIAADVMTIPVADFIGTAKAP